MYSNIFYFCYFSVRNGIPGKSGLFVISVTPGSLADKTGVRVCCLTFTNKLYYICINVV